MSASPAPNDSPPVPQPSAEEVAAAEAALQEDGDAAAQVVEGVTPEDPASTLPAATPEATPQQQQQRPQHLLEDDLDELASEQQVAIEALEQRILDLEVRLAEAQAVNPLPGPDGSPEPDIVVPAGDLLAALGHGGDIELLDQLIVGLAGLD